MVEQAFDDQCTGANPRYPLMSELKQMYLNAYYGEKHFKEKEMPTTVDNVKAVKVAKTAKAKKATVVSSKSKTTKNSGRAKKGSKKA